MPSPCYSGVLHRNLGKCWETGEAKCLKEQLKLNSFCKDSFEENNEKVLFYTGLPNWTLLLCIFNFVKALAPPLKGVLTPFQKFLLCVIRLRLNLSGKDLGYRFGSISASTVLRTFLHVVDVPYQRLKPLIIWPDRCSMKNPPDGLSQTLPKLWIPLQGPKHFLLTSITILFSIW